MQQYDSSLWAVCCGGEDSFNPFLSRKTMSLPYPFFTKKDPLQCCCVLLAGCILSRADMPV